MAKEQSQTETLVKDARVEALERELAHAQRALSETRGQLARTTEQLEATLPIPILPIEEQPFYEVVEAAVYTADNYYYPVGSRFRDKTGTMIPSASFMPLNGPAEKRVREWRASLPDGDETPNTDAILDAAYEISPFDAEGNLKAEAVYKASLVKLAIEKRNERKNVRHDPAKTALPGSHRHPSAVPMMTGMRKSFTEPVRRAAPLAERVDQPASASDALMKSLETAYNR
jgi:hypothetical protein